MVKKVLFVGGAIIALIVVYFWMTTLWPVMITGVNVADNATGANPAYAFSHAFIGMSPLWLFFVPAVIVVALVVIRLRQKEQG